MYCTCIQTTVSLCVSKGLWSPEQKSVQKHKVPSRVTACRWVHLYNYERLLALMTRRTMFTTFNRELDRGSDILHGHGAELFRNFVV